MKKIKALLITLLFVGFSSNLAFSQEQKSYKFDPNHTSVSWTVNHLGFSNVSGKFTDVSGSISLDEKKPEKSSVEVTINIASINTGLPKFDEHLKSKDLLNVKEFPNAKFVSKKVVTSGKNSAKIYGDLTLLGVTKEVVLDAKLNKSDVHPMNKKPTIGFSAVATINRSDFGINYAIPAVPDKVNLIIEAEANM